MNEDNKLTIISIEPSEGKYLNAIFKLYCLENNIDVEEVSNKFDVINGSSIGGVLK